MIWVGQDGVRARSLSKMPRFPLQPNLVWQSGQFLEHRIRFPVRRKRKNPPPSVGGGLKYAGATYLVLGPERAASLPAHRWADNDDAGYQNESTHRVTREFIP